MNVLHDVGSDDRMEVCLHEIEYEVNIFVVLGFQDIEKRHDVRVAVQLLQKDDLAISALGIGGVLERIEHLFQGNHCLSLLIDSLPDHPIRALTKFLQYLEFPQNMRFKFFCHSVNFIYYINKTD